LARTFANSRTGSTQLKCFARPVPLFAGALPIDLARRDRDLLEVAIGLTLTLIARLRSFTDKAYNMRRLHSARPSRQRPLSFNETDESHLPPLQATQPLSITFAIGLSRLRSRFGTVPPCMLPGHRAQSWRFLSLSDSWRVSTPGYTPPESTLYPLYLPRLACAGRRFATPP